MANSRTKNSFMNIIAGLGVQILTLLLTFITRTIFIKFLGVEYLGINGLFSNILSILSLAELGIGTAIVYSMYEPLKNNDTQKLNALVNYYKKLYTMIAIIVTVVGLAILPFLEVIVKLDKPINNLHLYYLLFLLNSVVSYLCIYKTSIVTAAQKEYKLKIYNIIFSVIQFVLQIFILVVFNNYLLYLSTQIIISMLGNIFKSKKSEQLYPFIKGTAQLEKEEKKSIWKNIKSLFLYQIGSVILNNTDNVLISTLVGTIWVGYYSNYNMLITTIATFASIIFTSLQASIGNLNIEADIEKKYKIFKVLDLISFWIYSFCSICFIILLQDFIGIWLGDGFYLNNIVVYICVFNFYIQGILYPIWCYRHTTGLFNHTRYAMLAASIINIVLSLLFGYMWGIFGILLATAISRITTNIWFEPYKLFKIYFKKPVSLYYWIQIKRLLLLIAIVVLNIVIANTVHIGNTMLNFVIKCIICLIVPNLILFMIYRNNEEFQYVYQKFISKLKKNKEL